jgi:putative acetyltransferase
VEARLLDELRLCDGWLPALSIVAEIDGAVVGHVVTTRGFVGDAPVLGLGPIGVGAPEPAWGKAFQVRTLTAYRSDIQGRFTYAPPFDRM